MRNEQERLYADIARRTGGNIYIGVTGPVRSGKSTFVKRVMQTLVLPGIADEYRRERARDELPQCGSGKTITTAEPKFVPEEAVEISPDGTAKLSVRLIDSVGYLVPGAVGATEDGKPRMVTTPWFDHEIPMTEAAELGTKKVMEDHSTVGVVLTTDGTVTELAAEDYAEATQRAVADMQATGKPFLVLLNTAEPASEQAQALAAEMAERWGVRCLPVNCLALEADEVRRILKALLFEFDVAELRFWLPGWLDALPLENRHKAALYEAMRKTAAEISKVAQVEPKLRSIVELTEASDCTLLSVDLGSGTADCRLDFPQKLFYGVLSEQSGVELKDDGALLALLGDYATVKREYARIADAVEQVRSTGYGMVLPSTEETVLEPPELVKKGGVYGIKLRASAPSIHMLRTDVRTEISPTVGDERQTEELVQALTGQYEGDAEALRQSNIFGKSVEELIRDGLNAKLTRLPEQARMRLQGALERIVNEGANGLICLLL